MRLPLAAALALTTCASAAGAESEAIALDYQVASGCPSRKTFVEEVRALTTRAEIVDADPALRQFRVEARRRGGDVQGRLTITKGEEHSEREVSGKSCGEVVSALALATAIAVDPSVLGGEPEPPPQPRPEEEPTPKPPQSSEPVRPRTPRPEEDRRPQPEAPRRTDAVLFALGAGVTSAVAPALGTRPAVRVGYRPAFTRAPEFFVEGGWLVPVEDENASFSAATGRLGATWEFWEVAGFGLGVVGGFELGVLIAEGGDGIRSPRIEERPWGAVDLGLSARYPVDSSFFVRLEPAGMFLTLYRHEYRIATPANEPLEVHRVPAVGFRAAGFVGLFL